MNAADYLRNVGSSLTSLAQYPLFLKRRLSWSLLFLLISYLVLGLVSASRIVWKDIPELETKANQTLEEVRLNFPADLSLEWNGQQLTHTGNSALKVPYPSFISPADLDLPPVLVYHLNQSIPEDQFAQQLPERSLIVVTPTELYMNDLQGDWNQIQLSELLGADSFSLNQATLPQYLDQAKAGLENSRGVLQIGTFFFIPVLLTLARIWSLAIETLLAFVLTRLNGIPLSLRHLFQLNLHIIVVAEVINLASQFLYGNHHWPLFSLTFWLLWVLIMITQRSQLLSIASGKAEKQQA